MHTKGRNPLHIKHKASCNFVKGTLHFNGKYTEHVRQSTGKHKTRITSRKCWDASETRGINIQTSTELQYSRGRLEAGTNRTFRVTHPMVHCLH